MDLALFIPVARSVTCRSIILHCGRGNVMGNALVLIGVFDFMKNEKSRKSGMLRKRVEKFYIVLGSMSK